MCPARDEPFSHCPRSAQALAYPDTFVDVRADRSVFLTNVNGEFATVDGQSRPAPKLAPRNHLTTVGGLSDIHCMPVFLWGDRRLSLVERGGMLRSLLLGVLVLGGCGLGAPRALLAGGLAFRADSKEDGKKGDPKDKAKDKEGAEPDPKKKDPGGDEHVGDGKGERQKTVVKPVSPDEAFVKENLKDALAPTAIEFLEDGRVHMTFDFKHKSEDHTGIFSPIVGSALKDKFRWSIQDEEHVIGGEAGLRLSNQGTALMNCWYLDDVEVEVQMLQHIAHTQKHIMALIFCNDQGKAIGTNYGCQVTTFLQGRPAGFRGKSDPITFEAVAKVKLVVRGGECQGFRQNRPREKMKYGQKSFASGRLGFAWGGSIAGTVTGFEVKGKLDYTRMAKEMRGGRK